jgi:methylene-tetrahydromethanopterin dehydrogenase
MLKKLRMLVYKMDTLELAPLKGKKLRVFLVKKAYDEPWWVTATPSTDTESALPFLHRPSMAYCEMVKELAEKEKPDFATDELGMRTAKEFLSGNPLADVFSSLGVTYGAVEMDETARAYLSHGIEEKMGRRNEILDSLKKLSSAEGDSEMKEKLDQLAEYGQYIHDELEDEIRQIEFGIRESWIAMGILKQTEGIDKKHIKAIHLCSPQHFEGLTRLLKEVEVEVTPVTFKRVLEDLPEESFRGMTELTGISSVKMIPEIKKAKAKLQNILFFLESDEYASPFDVCVAYDAGFDVVMPYSKVEYDNVEVLVQDAIFSRGTKGVKHTSFFIGGRDVPAARKMAKKAKKSMVGPFATSIVVDPHGAFTTSSALVAKAEGSLSALGIESFKGTDVLVLAGTGPVGESVAMLCAQAGANVVLTSRKQEKADKVAERLSTDEYAIKGVQVSNPKELRAVLKKATVVFAAGAPGIQLVSSEDMEAVKGKKIFLDANAVPPAGVEGLGAGDDLQELVAEKYGIGPLAVGDLKLKVQLGVLKEALKNPKGIYDDTSCLEIARELLEEQIAKGKIPTLKPLAKAK